MMGCLCFKASDIHEEQVVPRQRAISHSLTRQTVVPVRREEPVVTNNITVTNGGSVLAEKQASRMVRATIEEATRKGERTNQSGWHALHHAGSGADLHLRDTIIPRAAEGEQVAAGWPPWLAAVAGEAIKGWIPRRADSFEKLNKIGQGTYSNVYRARDLDNEKIVALKKVRFDNLEPESVRFMAREIHILRRLDHPNVIKLEGLVTSRMSCSLYLVFEYMEHDLAGLASNPGVKFTEPQIKCFMHQLLCGLDHCHSRGILHRDIKGSNLLIDNNGILKIADFGLAAFFYPGQKQPLTSRVVTLWYRPPELLLGATEYGVSVDLWSTGCILAELFACKPIMPGRTEVEQLHKIFKLCGSPSEEYWRKSKLPHATIFKPQQPYKRCVAETFKDFPSVALELMDVLLAIDPADRGTAASALKSEFFTTKPYACDPSSLPKYPPSKEIDAKLRDEEARRQKSASGRGQRHDSAKKGQRESKAIPAPEANAELAASLQKRQVQTSTKSTSEKFHIHQEDIASGFPIDPPKQHAVGEATAGSQGYPRDKISHSGPLVHPSAWAKRQKNGDGTPKELTSRDLSSLSSLVAAGRIARPDGHKEAGAPPQDHSLIGGEVLSSGSRASHSRTDQDQMQFQGRMSTHQRKDAKTAQRDQSLAYGPKGNKIHYSGPLVRSGNIDQVLKDHERQIQEAVRRARLDKVKVARIPAGG